MDLASTFDDVLSIARQGKNADTAWASLVRYLEERGGASLRQLADVDMQRDVESVRQHIQKLVSSEPPPSDLNAVYFGLFDAVDGDGAEVIGYYIAGVRGFDPEDGDSLCDPAWWPEKRYLRSEALDAVKDAELRAKAGGQTEVQALLGYAGQLGTALLVSRFSSAGLFPGRHCVVGFDSGDFAEIAT